MAAEKTTPGARIQTGAWASQRSVYKERTRTAETAPSLLPSSIHDRRCNDHERLHVVEEPPVAEPARDRGPRPRLVGPARGTHGGGTTSELTEGELGG